MNLSIQADQLWSELERLSSYSDAPAPAVTRVVFSDHDLLARAYVKQLCRDAGLVVREDAVGNTFAKWLGEDPGLPAVATGSHIDAIPNAGRFDGTVGVLGGLEAIRALQRANYKPRRSIELILFTSEEPTRFGVGCLGSRLMSGTLDAECGTRLRDRAGQSLNEIRKAAGFLGPLETVRLPGAYYTAFVELHIEQGALLERARVPIGIVTGIAAPASLRVSIEGEGGHAGAVLMPGRRDAFCAAAEIVLGVEAAAKSSGSTDTVATAGICDVFPGAVNSIPSLVRLEIDVRDVDGGRRDTALAAITQIGSEVAARRGVTVHIETVNKDAPAASSEAIVDALAKACATQGIACQTMVSRAYHDSLFMAQIAPTAMLFIPCRSGVSHRPDEYASPEDIANGAHVLAETLGSLAEV
ncbi:MAG: M20 family metallo-hydrolase [Bryobacteraceae bacterium]